MELMQVRRINNMYNPKPVDTSDISLPEELLALTK